MATDGANNGHNSGDAQHICAPTGTIYTSLGSGCVCHWGETTTPGFGRDVAPVAMPPPGPLDLPKEHNRAVWIRQAVSLTPKWHEHVSLNTRGWCGLQCSSCNRVVQADTGIESHVDVSQLLLLLCLLVEKWWKDLLLATLCRCLPCTCGRQ